VGGPLGEPAEPLNWLTSALKSDSKVLAKTHEPLAFPYAAPLTPYAGALGGKPSLLPATHGTPPAIGSPQLTVPRRAARGVAVVRSGIAPHVGLDVQLARGVGPLRV
jgi:hypothetical protein